MGPDNSHIPNTESASRPSALKTLAEVLAYAVAIFILAERIVDGELTLGDYVVTFVPLKSGVFDINRRI